MTNETIQQLLENSADELMQKLITEVILASFEKGDSPEQAVETIKLVTKVFEAGRSLGKAEAAAEILDMVQDQ